MSKYDEIIEDIENNINEFLTRNRKIRRGSVGCQAEFFPEDEINPFRLQRMLMEKGYSVSIYHDSDTEKVTFTVMKYVERS